MSYTRPKSVNYTSKKAVQGPENSYLEALRAGDEQAFGMIFKTYNGALCNYAYSFLHDRDEAEEIVQGTFLISEHIYANIDLISDHVSIGQWTPALSMVNKLYAGLDFQVAKNLSLAGGVTLNGYITDTTYEGYSPLFTDLTPGTIYEHSYSNDIDLKMWWGFKLGFGSFELFIRYWSLVNR